MWLSMYVNKSQLLGLRGGKENATQGIGDGNRGIIQNEFIDGSLVEMHVGQ